VQSFVVFCFKTQSLAQEKNYILDETTAAKKLRRMAYEIIENNTGETSLVLAGIRESGTVMAKNIQRLLMNKWHYYNEEKRKCEELMKLS